MVLLKMHAQKAVGAEKGMLSEEGGSTDPWVTFQQEREELEKHPVSVNVGPGHPKQWALSPTFSTPLP